MRVSRVLAIAVVITISTAQLWADGVPSQTDDLEQARLTQFIERLNLQPTEDNSLQQYQELGSGDENVVMAAAKALLNKNDDDVMYAILTRLKVEMTANNPNTELIVKMVNLISRVADKRFDKIMRNLGEIIRNKDYKLKSKRKKVLYNAFGDAYNKIENRDELESIAARPVIVVSAVSPTAVNSTYPRGANSFGEYLNRQASEKPQGPRFGKRDMPETPEGFLLKSVTRIRSDEFRKLKREGKNKNWVKDQAVMLDVMAVLGREKGRLPTLVGASGVGKSATNEMIAEAIVDGEILRLWPSEYFEALFANAEVVETTPARISQMALSNEATAQAAALELFFDSVRKTQAQYKSRTGSSKPIIVLIDNIQDFDLPQLSALEHELENTVDPIIVIATARVEPLDLKLEVVTGLQKSVQKIPVREKTNEETEQILRETFLPGYATQFHVTLTDTAIETAIRTASLVRPGVAAPEAPIRMVEDMIIAAHLKNPSSQITLNENDVYQYVERITRLPVGGHDPAALQRFLDDVRSQLNGRVVNQPRMIDAAITGLRRTLTGDPRKPTTMLFLGPTGTGKTLVSEKLAELGYQDNARKFEINGGDLQSIDDMGSIFGDSQRIGRLMQWLDDPSGGLFGGVIVWNEVDKMHPAVFERVMEFVDRGVLTSGHDGRIRVANRHMIIMTSNHGAKKLFPESVASWSEAEVEARLKNMDETAIRGMLQQVDLDGTTAKNLKPEIVGRIDIVAVAGPIITSKQPLIASVEIGDNVERIKTDSGILVNASDANLAAKLGLAPGVRLSGARAIREQVKRYIDKAVETAQARWPQIKRGDEIKLSLEAIEFGTDRINIEFAGQKISIDAPSNGSAHPMSDPKFRQLLAELPEKMHAHMVEQPEAVEILVRAVQARFADRERRRPVSFMAIGRTGLGKTEIGKALAKALYGSVSRHTVIAMGKIATPHDWETLFETQFEKYLSENPEGGVLILDEISNMGAGKDSAREALFKNLYDLKEEGIWVSRRDPRIVYDLRKHIIIDTGNDLEKLLQNATTDEELISIWHSNNSHEKIVRLLRGVDGKGIPEAYLGRQDAIVMFKPLVRKAKARITEAILKDIISERLLSQHPGLKIEWEPIVFADALSQAFFSQSSGARSVRSAIENEVTAAISAQLMKVQYDPRKISQMTLKLSLSDNLPARPYLSINQPEFQRKVLLKVAEIKNGQEVDQEISDVTVKAEQSIIPNEDEARLSAVRSVARAITNEPANTGLKLSHMSVRARTKDGQAVIGYDHYLPVSQITKVLTRKALIARMAVIWAGRLAVEKAGGDPEAQWSDDLNDMQELYNEFVKKFGKAIAFDVTATKLSTEAELSSEARKIADAYVEEKWMQISHIANDLAQAGEFSAEQFKTLAGVVPPPETCKSFLIRP